jgi:hypothetical protein
MDAVGMAAILQRSAKGVQPPAFGSLLPAVGTEAVQMDLCALHIGVPCTLTAVL